jgi:hypothetical protein
MRGILKSGRTADSSTSLRFAQDDTFVFEMGIIIGGSIFAVASSRLRWAIERKLERLRAYRHFQSSNSPAKLTT